MRQGVIISHGQSGPGPFLTHIKTVQEWIFFFMTFAKVFRKYRKIIDEDCIACIGIILNANGFP